MLKPQNLYEEPVRTTAAPSVGNVYEQPVVYGGVVYGGVGNVYEQPVATGGDDAGPVYATPLPSDGTAGSEAHYDGWTVNATYAAPGADSSKGGDGDYVNQAVVDGYGAMPAKMATATRIVQTYGATGEYDEGVGGGGGGGAAAAPIFVGDRVCANLSQCGAAGDAYGF